MHLLFTDETNVVQSADAKFFAHGGLIVDAAVVPTLTRDIAGIRKAAGYGPDDRLKFDTHARPPHVTQAQAKLAKRAVIQACITHNCSFIVCVVLHSIARKHSGGTVVEQGANTVIAKFNSYLHQHSSDGAVIIDRLPDGEEYSYLANKFAHGLRLQGAKEARLDRIHLLASSCIGASHCASAMDIVLGALRFCINNPKNTTAAAAMMTAVTRLIWHERDGESIYAFERGLLFRPKVVKIAAYKSEYDALLARINALLKEADTAPQDVNGRRDR